MTDVYVDALDNAKLTQTSHDAMHVVEEMLFIKFFKKISYILLQGDSGIFYELNISALTLP